MEEISQEASGQPEVKSSAPDQESNQTQKDQVAYDTYRKVLGEKKKTQAQVEQLSSELERYKQAELESTGKKDELIQSLRERSEQAETKNKEMLKSFAWRSVSSQVKAEANKAGCVDSDALLKLVDLGAVEVGEDFTVNQTDLTAQLEEAKKAHPYLFSKPAPSVSDSPLGVRTQTANEKMAGMTLDEKIAMLSTLGQRK